MEYSCCSLNFILFFISLMLATFRTYGNPPVPVSNVIQSLQKELEEVMSRTENLKTGKTFLIKEINMTESSCNETLSKLKESHSSLVDILLKRNQTVGILMQRLVEEDELHAKLESKLKKLYSDLDVLGVMYETKYQELFLLESRRLNGTDLYCETIIKKIEEPKIKINKSKLQARSLSTWQIQLKGNHFKEIALKNRINIAKIEESQLKSEYEALALKKGTNMQLCNLKTSNLKNQITFIEEVLKDFEGNIEVLNTNIHTSIFLTESLKVEILFGEKLLNSMKTKIFKFEQLKESFKTDEQCYATIKGTV